MKNKNGLLEETDFLSQFAPKIRTVSFDKHRQEITPKVAKLNFYEASFKTSKNKKIIRYFPSNLTPFKKKNYKRILEKEIFSKKILFVFTGLQKEKLISTDIPSGHELYHVPLTKIEKTWADRLPFKKKFKYAVVSSQNVIQYYKHLSLIQANEWIAVGPETADLLKKKLNLLKVKIPGKYSAVQAANLILNLSPNEPKKRGSVIWLGAKGGATEGVKKLTQSGFHVQLIYPYRAIPLSAREIYPVWEENKMTRDHFLKKKAIWIFTSPLAASNYLKQKLYREDHFISCLGFTTASVFFKKELTPYHIASKSTLHVLREELNIISGTIK